MKHSVQLRRDDVCAAPDQNHVSNLFQVQNRLRRGV
jgi:hypothetical protein